MITNLKNRIQILFILIMLSMIVLTSCAEYGNVKYRTWIDFPQPGTSFYLGDAIPVTAHYYAVEEANNVVVRINDRVVVEMPPDPLDATAKITHQWTPDEVGNYLIAVSILDQNGDPLSSARVEVSVIEEPEVTEGTFIQNGFCRFGPGTDYPPIAIFDSGYQISLEARSESLTPLWWYVFDPITELFCWVSDVVIETEVNPENILTMKAPPMPKPVSDDPGSGGKACHKDLNIQQCIAAGGTWYPKFDVPPFCVCPE